VFFSFYVFMLVRDLLICNTQDGQPRPLLPPIAPQHAGRKCLVLDLDETLVHSSFKVGILSSLNFSSFLTLYA
jgi:TFIIF-interacting CTD phosphatase-like protein